MLPLLASDWGIKGKRNRKRWHGRVWDRQTASYRRIPQHKLHWALFPLRTFSGELCARWLAVHGPHSKGRAVCLSAEPLLGERTWLQGCSWFEMVPILTPGGRQPGRIGSLNLSFLRLLRAVELGGCGESEQEGGFHLDCEQLSGFPPNYREWLHPTSSAARHPLPSAWGPQASQPLSTVSAHNWVIKWKLSLAQK